MHHDESDRIFLRLAEDGCGVGCRYCYISRPAGAVRPLDQSSVDHAIAAVGHHVGDGSSPLLSIGCDTEVASDPRVVVSALRYLQFAAERELPAQLATKFPLDRRLIEALDAWPDTAPMPVVFTTITTVSDAARIEPGAPPAADRARNFDAPRRRWASYALVKPFGPATVRDQDRLLELFAEHRPDGVVLGTRYRARPPQRRDAHEYVLPVAPSWRSDGLPARADELVDRLTDLGLRTFKTTRCVTAFHNRTSHGRIIRERFRALCVECGACTQDTHPAEQHHPDRPNARARRGTIGRRHSSRSDRVLVSSITPGVEHRRTSHQGGVVTSRLETVHDQDSESVEELIRLVSDVYQPDSPTHDLSHLSRVASLAGQLADELGADQLTVHCAAWLHDLHRDSGAAQTAFFSSPEQFDETARRFLTDAGVRAEVHEAILTAIHYTDRYSFADRRPAAGPSVEATCVRDADNLDALGAIGVARAFSFGGSHQIPIWDPDEPLGSNRFEQTERPSSTIHHFYDKLLRLEQEFETETARTMAKTRTDFLRTFADELLQEWRQDIPEHSAR